MSHLLSKSDPLYYKKVILGLIDEAKENGVNIFIPNDIIIFNDEDDNGVCTTRCGLDINYLVNN